jgi:type II secretory pathway pseudopilin PulG
MTHWTRERTALISNGRQAIADSREGGFTYIGVLVLVALMGIALASVGQVWHTMQQREKEQELLFIGRQFRVAIKRFVDHAPPQARRYPVSLEELLKDPRYPGTQRYLRTIYRDPMTGKEEWGLITAPSGEIYGVHSLSENEPLKKGNFGLADKNFEGKMKYSEWLFMYAPA